MRHNPERLAWTVLLISFAIFCLLAIGFPLLVRSYLLNARQPLNAQVNAQRGTVRVDRAGSVRTDATGVGDPLPMELFKGDAVRTGPQNEGLLVVQEDQDGSRTTLASVVIYDNSHVVLVDAYAPRFGVSSGPHNVVLKMNAGRVRIEVQPSNDGRTVQAEVQTDHTRIWLSEGSYALSVSNQQTTATVRRGSATVRTDGQELALGGEQRAVVSQSGQLDGPLPAERNLVDNGDFGRGIEALWVRLANPPNSSASVSEATGDEGQSVAKFVHDEPQPSEVGLIQTLNSNVKDLASLVLHIKVRVDSHSLAVCGSLGSECPMMVRIDYLDSVGNGQQWVHGFYAFDDPTITNPYYCTTCPNPSSGTHSRVPEQSWFLYDSPNLMEINPPELRPAVIQSVLIYASGHSYDAMATDVELLAQE